MISYLQQWPIWLQTLFGALKLQLINESCLKKKGILQGARRSVEPYRNTSNCIRDQSIWLKANRPFFWTLSWRVSCLAPVFLFCSFLLCFPSLLCTFLSTGRWRGKWEFQLTTGQKWIPKWFRCFWTGQFCTLPLATGCTAIPKSCSTKYSQSNIPATSLPLRDYSVTCSPN